MSISAVTASEGAYEQFLALKQSAIQSCAQCEAFITSIDEDAYRRGGPGRSSIGAHTRHVIDFMLCFFRGVESGVIDYDARERQQEIETSPSKAASIIQQLLEHFRQLDVGQQDKPFEVCETVSDDGVKVSVPTSLERELMMLISHTIHHLGIMKILAEDLGFTLNDRMGKAHATIVYEAG